MTTSFPLLPRPSPHSGAPFLRHSHLLFHVIPSHSFTSFPRTLLRHSRESGNPSCHIANWIPNQVGNDVCTKQKKNPASLQGYFFVEKFFSRGRCISSYLNLLCNLDYTFMPLFSHKYHKMNPTIMIYLDLILIQFQLLL